MSITAFDELELCRTHFIAEAYRHLESMGAQIAEADFHSRHGEASSRLLEKCMREVTNIACAADPPDNLQRAQLLDILLWASELYARLRRGPRVPATIPILVRSEDEERPWEEKTETQLLSVHGFSFTCRHGLQTGDLLTCVRLDNGRRAAARVAWARANDSGQTEAGVEFVADEDFWGMEASVTTRALSYRGR